MTSMTRMRHRRRRTVIESGTEPLLSSVCFVTTECGGAPLISDGCRPRQIRRSSHGFAGSPQVPSKERAASHRRNLDLPVAIFSLIVTCLFFLFSLLLRLVPLGPGFRLARPRGVSRISCAKVERPGVSFICNGGELGLPDMAVLSCSFTCRRRWACRAQPRYGSAMAIAPRAQPGEQRSRRF